MDEEDDEQTAELPTYLLNLKNKVEDQKNKLLQDDIQEEKYEIDINNLKQLYSLGKGAFGSVSIFLDTKNYNKYAQKYIADLNLFQEEKKNMQDIQEKIGDDFDQIGEKLQKYDNQKQTLYFQLGQCTLEEFCKVRSENNIWMWNYIPEIIYIAKTLINFVLKLSQYDIYHSDIKPGNIVLSYTQVSFGKNLLKIKLIDFGGSSTDWEEIKAYTQEYYPDINQFPFKNKESRIKAELYSVGRSLLKIMIIPICYKEYLPQESLFNQDSDKLNLIYQKLEVYYPPILITVLKGLLQNLDYNEYQKELNQFDDSLINDDLQLIKKINQNKETIQIKEITEENLEDEFIQCEKMGLYERGLLLMNQIEEKRIHENLGIGILKIHILGKLGQLSEETKLIRLLRGMYYNKELKYFESQKQKEAFILLLIKYQGVIQDFQIQEKTKGMILELCGTEECFLMGYYFQTIGIAQCSLSFYVKKSIENLDQAIEIFEKVYKTKENLQIAECYRYLARAYYEQRNSQKALECYENEKKIRFQIQGEFHIEFAGVLLGMNTIYKQMSEFDKGYQMILEVEKIYQKMQLSEENSIYVLFLDWKAFYLKQFKQIEEATLIQEKAVFLFRKVFGSGQTFRNTISSNKKFYLSNHDYIKRVKEFVIKPLINCVKNEDWQNAQYYYDIAYFYLTLGCIDYQFPKYPIDKKEVQNLQLIMDIKLNQIVIYNTHKEKLKKEEKFQYLNQLVEAIPDILVEEKGLFKIKRLEFMTKMKNTFSKEQVFEIALNEYNSYQKLNEEVENLNLEEFEIIYGIIYEKNKENLYKDIKEILFKINAITINFILILLDNEKNLREGEILWQKADFFMTQIQNKQYNNQQKSYVESTSEILFKKKLNYYIKIQNFQKVDQELKKCQKNLKKLNSQNPIDNIVILDEFRKYYLKIGNQFENTKILKEMRRIAIENNQESIAKDLEEKIQKQFEFQKNQTKLLVENQKKTNNIQKQQDQLIQLAPLTTEIEFQPQDLENFQSLEQFKTILNLQK